MKVLSTEQQTELQGLIEFAGNGDLFSADVKAQFNYWSIELKPKRVRRKSDLTPTTISV